MEGFEFTFLIAAFWFPLYWILGGVVFATVAILRVTKLRKVRFSCLFTLASLLASYGASYSGMILGENEIRACMEGTTGFLDSASAIIGCGILSFFLAGGIGFIILVAVGLVILFISRASNQSWVDSDEGLNEKADLLFDTD